MKILRLCGIPIHKILSDTEFVDKNRKALRLSKKLAWIHVSVLTVITLFLPWLIGVVQQAIEQIPDGIEKWAWLSLLLGFVLGILLSYYVITAIQVILMAFDPFDYNRGTKLLIKYHDMLREKGAIEKTSEQHDEQVFRQT